MSNNKLVIETKEVETDFGGKGYLVEKGAFNRLIFEADELQRRVTELEQLVSDYDEVNQDKKRLAKKINDALGGDAEQPSLCDIVPTAEKVKSERDSLAAHVEVLSNALVSICDEGISFDFEDVNQILEQSPQTSLAEVKAKQAEESFQVGVEFGRMHYRKIPFESSLVPNEAENYANKIRNGKDG